MSTVRFKINRNEKVEKLMAEDKQFTFFLWHNQIALLIGGAKIFKLATMISRSKDGDLLVPFVESMGHKVVRASSSRGASTGLMELVEAMKDRNYHGAMAVDGPRGPVYKAKPGFLYLAKKSDKIVVPVLCDCEKFYRFNSWDKFIMPKLFSKATITIMDPIFLDDSEEKDVVEKELAEVENKVMEMTRVYSKNII